MNRPIRCRSVAVAALVGAFAATLTLGGVLAGAGPAAAAPRPVASGAVDFTSAAAAPVMQITEDEPTAQFHPEGEGDYGYTLVTANPSAATALASVLWPGSAAGNAGTLVEVLGGPTVSALNDPVQASATSGTSQTHSSVSTPAGTTMSASVDPLGPTDQHSTATTALAGGSLGSGGSVGASTSTSTIDFDSSTGLLSVTAQSGAANVDLAGVVKIGSVTSSASASSANGATPQLSGATTVHQMSIAGQAAYLDGSGVHLGEPGAPAGPAAVDTVDSALAAAGMEVYFNSPHTVTVGGTSYYYSASILFYWVPPQDPSHNSFTFSVGGSAVSLTASQQADAFPLGLDGTSRGAQPTAGTGGGTAVPASSAPDTSGSALPVAVAPQVAGVAGGGDTGAPTSLTASGPGGATLSLPASPAAAASATVGRGAGAAVTLAARLPGGVGAGWWVLVALAAIVGAGLTTRVPGLLQRQAAPPCPRARQPRSSFNNRKERS